MADALVSIVTSPSGSRPKGPKALAHLRVDIGALRRGNTEPVELCEIAGVGPVSVATARELLGDSIAKVLVTSATDVHSICNLGRAVPARLHSALSERDPCWVVPGCSLTYNLEIDHRVVPFANGGATELENLARICHHHHFLKRYEGYSLQGEPGAWVWVHPDGTRREQNTEPPPRKTTPPAENRPPGTAHHPGRPRPTIPTCPHGSSDPPVDRLRLATSHPSQASHPTQESEPTRPTKPVRHPRRRTHRNRRLSGVGPPQEKAGRRHRTRPAGRPARGPRSVLPEDRPRDSVVACWLLSSEESRGAVFRRP